MDFVNNFFVVMSKNTYNGVTDVQPLMQKISDVERAILVWKTKDAAQAFIQSRRLEGFHVEERDDDYIQERILQYKNQALILKIKVVS